MEIKPGALHKANGGYIIFQAKDLLSNPICYETLKKCLRTKEVAIENALEQRSSMLLISPCIFSKISARISFGETFDSNCGIFLKIIL